MARPKSPSKPDLSRWAPWLVALATLLVFVPSIGNDFVNWDDDRNFLDNPNYRSLGLTQVRWVFNTFVLGQNALANCLLRQGQAAEAVPHYEAALETAPDYADAHYNLGVALEYLGNSLRAVYHYRQAADLDHLNPDAINAIQRLSSIQ